MSQPIDRIEDLPPRVRRLALRAQQWIARGEHALAGPLLDEAIAAFPAHPELLRLCALTELHAGHVEQAIELLRIAAQSRPQDGLIAGNLGAALAQAGEIDGALQTLERATALDPTQVDAWFNLGRARELRADAAGAHAALSAVLELDPAHRPARILRAEALKTLGQIDEAESELRDVLAHEPGSVSAWVALVNLKSFQANADDLRVLGELYASDALSLTQRIDAGFAYAQLLEASGHYPQAFAVFRAVNAAKRTTLRWDAPAVTGLIDRILAAFDPTPLAPQPSGPGSDVVFLVGTPRSGSTLAEQILAAHPAASAGSETGFIARLLQHESKRRGALFPEWVPQATDADWKRLGAAYLERIAAKKGDASIFTDKTLTNWQTLGAIRRMLPGARVVHCRRDALETAWSCYKHNFAQDQLYSYDIAELAAYFRDEERAMRSWTARHPGWIHEHRYEALIADPQAAVSALLAHCGLAFDPACLRFHEAGREVRTASAAQVRRPLQRDTGVARHYGPLLDPLRAALAS